MSLRVTEANFRGKEDQVEQGQGRAIWDKLRARLTGAHPELGPAPPTLREYARTAAPEPTVEGGPGGAGRSALAVALGPVGGAPAPADGATALGAPASVGERTRRKHGGGPKPPEPSAKGAPQEHPAGGELAEG